MARGGAPTRGRDVERARLRERLEGAARADPAVVVVRGPDGIGRTRLLDEVHADASAVAVLRGRCLPSLSVDLPFGPVGQALRPLLGRDGDALLSPTERAGLAPVMPLLRDDALPPPRERWGRARAFELVLRLLQRRAEQDPVVLIVDDVQWADHGTLDLLRFLGSNLTRERALIVVDAVLDPPGVPDSIRAGLDHLAESSDVLDLGLLDDAAVAAIAHDVAPLLTGLQLGAVVERASGNPRFAVELAIAAADQPPGAAAPLPRRLVDLLRSRLRHLDGTATTAVEVAALWRPGAVPHQVLQEVVAVPPGRLDTAIRRAIALRVLIAADDGYTVAHPLLAEVVAASMLAGARAGLHGRLAGVLETHPDAVGDAEQRDVALAWHWEEARRPTRAVPALHRAGRNAMARRSFADAARLLSRALDQAPEPDPGTALLLAGALRWSGDAGAAERRLRDVIERTASDGPGADAPAGLAWEALARVLAEQGRTDDALAAASRAAAASNGPASERARITLAGIEVVRGDYLQARSRLEDLVENNALADGELAYALTILGTAQANTGAVEAAVPTLERALELSRRSSDQESVVRACVNLSYVLQTCGRWSDAVDVATQGGEVAREAGLQRVAGAMLAANAASALLEQGRLGDADRTATDAAMLTPPKGVAQYLSAVRAEVAAWRGDAEQALTLLGSFAATPEDPVTYAQAAWVRAHLARGGGDAGRAHAAVRSALDALGERAEPSSAVRLCLEGLLALDELGGGRGTGGREPETRRLAHQARRLADGAGDLVPLRDLADCCEAETAGHGAGQVEIWSQLASRPTVLSRPLLAAHVGWRAAQAAHAAGARKATRRRLQQALDALQGCGAGPLERGLLEAARTWGVPWPAERRHDGAAALGLTHREREVVGLLAGGASNRHIARALGMSEKTASVHVSNIMRKLSVGSRAEAAVAVHRLNLLEE